MTQLNLSDKSTKVIRLAEGLAQEYGQGVYEAEHLLWAVCNQDIGLSECFTSLRVDQSALKNWTLSRIERLPKSQRYVDVPKAGPTAQVVLQETQKLCSRYGYDKASPLDILEACLTPDVSFNPEDIRRMPVALYEVVEWRQSNDLSVQLGEQEIPKNGTSSKLTVGSSSEILSRYCVELNSMAEQGKIDPVIGRDKELKQLMEILGKRISPNVMIVGEPGVGKTSIIGGLVLRIKEGTVSDQLKDAQVLELDVSGRLVAGAFKGEVEERMKSILEAIKSNGRKTLLFIDEIHILLDEKGPVGSGVVNLLKPELSRGEITIIGATTQSEYQKYVEKDAAFKRRFSKLVIEEPDERTAYAMLKGLTARYTDFHRISIDSAAVMKSVTLAKKYVKDKNLPASAIELMDYTMACAVQMKATSTTVLDTIEHKMEQGDLDSVQGMKNLEDNLSELLLGRLQEDDTVPANLRPTLDKVRTWTAEEKESIDAEDVEAITAYTSGIPMGRVKAGEGEKIQQAGTLIRQRVVGQDRVVDEVVKSLKAFRADLKEPGEPGAIFFFTGPTGTGKTELAKAIAELLFDDEHAMLRFDMSEFQESHSVATLLGAPPGYAGYEEGGILVNNVRKNPYSVVLFDEIEKAHKDIYGIFLQMLTDGRLQDKQGKLADFSNTIIIFTSNAGAHDIVNMYEQGKEPSGDELKEILRSTGHFKDEFLGRVDSQIMPFRPITEEVARLILGIHCKKFVKLLKRQHDVELHIGEGIKDHLIEIGFSPIYGARPLKSAIKTFLTPPMADKIISGKIKKGDRVTIALEENGEIDWQIESTEMELA